jgi:hypothetical protein
LYWLQVVVEQVPAKVVLVATVVEAAVVVEFSHNPSVLLKEFPIL